MTACSLCGSADVLLYVHSGPTAVDVRVVFCRHCDQECPVGETGRCPRCLACRKTRRGTDPT